MDGKPVRAEAGAGLSQSLQDPKSSSPEKGLVLFSLGTSESIRDDFLGRVRLRSLIAEVFYILFGHVSIKFIKT